MKTLITSIIAAVSFVSSAQALVLNCEGRTSITVYECIGENSCDYLDNISEKDYDDKGTFLISAEDGFIFDSDAIYAYVRPYESYNNGGSNYYDNTDKEYKAVRSVKPTLAWQHDAYDAPINISVLTVDRLTAMANIQNSYFESGHYLEDHWYASHLNIDTSKVYKINRTFVGQCQVAKALF